MRRRLAWVLLALVLGLGASAAAPLPARREALPGGATLLVTERPHPPIVVVRVHLRAGGVFDPPDAPGLANLTAELLTRGTALRSGPELDEAIEFVGGRLESHAGRDGVTLSLSVLTKDVGLGLDLLFEVLTRPTFPEAERERTVKEIQAAIRRSGDSPETVASRALAAMLYPGHPYGRPVMGTVETVGRLTREQVVAFYRRHYRPDSAILVVAGDVRADQIRQEISARLASWQPGAAAPVAAPQWPASVAAQSRTVRRELTQATVLLGRPAVGHGHPDYYPLVVATYILGGGSASRLYSRVREERGLAYDVSSYLSVGRYGAASMVGLQTRTEAVAEAIRLVRAEMARLGTDPVSERELALARAYLVGSFPLRADTTSKMGDLLLTVEEMGLGLDYPVRYRHEIEKVTAEDVQRAARRYLDPSGYSIVTVGDLP